MSADGHPSIPPTGLRRIPGTAGLSHWTGVETVDIGQHCAHSATGGAEQRAEGDGSEKGGREACQEDRGKDCGSGG